MKNVLKVRAISAGHSQNNVSERKKIYIYTRRQGNRTAHTSCLSISLRRGGKKKKTTLALLPSWRRAPSSGCSCRRRRACASPAPVGPGNKQHVAQAEVNEVSRDNEPGVEQRVYHAAASKRRGALRSRTALSRCRRHTRTYAAHEGLKPFLWYEPERGAVGGGVLDEGSGCRWGRKKKWMQKRGNLSEDKSDGICERSPT